MNTEQIDLTYIVKLYKQVDACSFPDRFASKVVFGDDCWLWQAALDPCGYGQFYWNGRPRKAHRVAYELAVGPIPDGLELDHLCRIRHCVRPEHLDAVPHHVNVGRGLHGVLTTHCPQGHPYDQGNTYVGPGSHRRCRTCDRTRSRDRQRRLSDERSALHGRKSTDPRGTWTCPDCGFGGRGPKTAHADRCLARRDANHS